MTHDDVTAGRPRPNEDALRAIDFLLLDVDGVLTDGRVHFDFEGREYKSGQFPFMANGRALGMGHSEGFVKMLADAKTDEILGVHIVGRMASELISEAVVAMEFRASSEDIARICHAHPSLSEATKEAALAVDKRALNF